MSAPIEDLTKGINRLAQAGGKTITAGDKIRRVLGYGFAGFMARWLQPSIDIIKTNANELIIRYGFFSPSILDLIGKTGIYLLVLAAEIGRIIIVRIVSLDGKIGMLTDQIKVGALTRTQLYWNYGEILISSFIIYYMVTGWKLPLIGRDISIQQFWAWNSNQGLKDKSTMWKAILTVIVLWEVYAIQQTGSPTVPFDGILRFGQLILSPGGFGQALSPTVNVTANMTI